MLSSPQRRKLISSASCMVSCRVGRKAVVVVDDQPPAFVLFSEQRPFHSGSMKRTSRWFASKSDGSNRVWIRPRRFHAGFRIAEFYPKSAGFHLFEGASCCDFWICEATNVWLQIVVKFLPSSKQAARCCPVNWVTLVEVEGGVEVYPQVFAESSSFSVITHFRWGLQLWFLALFRVSFLCTPRK